MVTALYNRYVTMPATDLNPSAIAWDSTDHYNGDRLKDWDVIESVADVTTDTLRRVTGE